MTVGCSHTFRQLLEFQSKDPHNGRWTLVTGLCGCCVWLWGDGQDVQLQWICVCPKLTEALGYLADSYLPDALASLLTRQK